MITKDFISYTFSCSLILLILTTVLNIILVVFTRTFGSQEFHKYDNLYIFFKCSANLSFLVICCMQGILLYLYYDYTYVMGTAMLFFEYMTSQEQAHFYGRMYEYPLTRGLLSYQYSIDAFGIIIQLVGLLIGYISYLALDTRFFYNNIKYLGVFSIFSAVVLLYTTTTNIIFFFLFYELLLLPAFLLIYFLSQPRRAKQASLYFVIWTQLGSFLVLCATAYVVVLTGKYTFAEAHMFNFTQFELYLIFFLYFVGFGFKVPIWPLHYWLTKTHVEASAGFSMYLSGFLVKTALYGFYKYTSILGLGINTTLFIVIAVMGIIDASIKMFGQVDLKKLVAFCTIQEMNIIYMMLCWGDSTGCTSAMLFTITHSFLSALMFFIVDCVQKRFNSRSILELSGILHVTPNLGIAILFMCVLFCGLPGTMKFTCEFFIFSQLIGVSLFLTAVLLVIANFIGVVGFCRCWFNVTFGMSVKLAKVGAPDLNSKELGIIAICIMFLIVFCYIPCIVF